MSTGAHMTQFLRMLILMLTLSFFLTACGQTGKLYLPDPVAPKTQTAAD